MMTIVIATSVELSVVETVAVIVSPALIVESFLTFVVELSTMYVSSFTKICFVEPSVVVSVMKLKFVSTARTLPATDADSPTAVSIAVISILLIDELSSSTFAS